MMKRILTRKAILSVVIGLVLIFLASGGFLLWAEPNSESTNDAYIQADLTYIAPRVSGQIAEVAVEDNQPVRVGDLLVRLDGSDYEAALKVAKADVDVAKADLAHLVAEIARHPVIVAQAEATAAADQAALNFALADAERYHRLAARGAGSLQKQQQADSRLEQLQANLEKDRAIVRSAKQELAELEAERAKAKGQLERALANMQQAKLDLSYTEVRAPVSGWVGQRGARTGAIVAPGDHLMAIVPLENAYVVANFQEDQLAHMRIGQSVRIKVDSFPNDVLKGRVESLAPATGATFAALPPDNATGNFTKIVQRLPVKISIDPGQPMASALRVGMSVVPTVELGQAAQNRAASATNADALNPPPA